MTPCPLRFGARVGAGVFFLDTPTGCENCRISPIIDGFVDVTPALRRNKIHPQNARLHVLAKMSSGLVKPSAHALCNDESP